MTTQGNRHVVVFHDFLSKWPMVYPVPDQKTERIVKLLVNEVVPFFGVPEALLSNRGANLLSHLMLDVWHLLGIQKLSTTAYHPQCDSWVERFKSMLRKQAAKFGAQWDKCLPGVLWAYTSTPHESTKETPSFLLFGMDWRSPTDAAILPSHPLEPTQASDYREELILSLSSARQLACKEMQKSQERYKHHYDKSCHVVQYQIGCIPICVYVFGVEIKRLSVA